MPEKIVPCPEDSMKCVSTLNTEGYPAMEAIPFTGRAEDAMAAVKRVVADYPRTSITVSEPGYLATIFRTRVIRWKDTVQFEIDDVAKLIHFRSESVPFAGGDLGANRKRMTEVRALLIVALS